MAGAERGEEAALEQGLLAPEEPNQLIYTGDGSVDFSGNPVVKETTGRWKACPFILGNECCERLAYYGISTNLVTYLTKKLHDGNASAASNVTTWQGTCYLTPLIGAILADAYWGRYWTIATFSTIYFIGMAILTLSASVPVLMPPSCEGSFCPPASPFQYTVFFLGLYLIALGTGGIKPCVSSFGADQFDDTDPSERIQKGSFFNWFYFSINIGALISSSFLVWVQDNVGWGLGFGIPTVFMGLAIISFFSGTSIYRFQKPGGSPITRVCQVVVASLRKWHVHVPEDSSLLYELPDGVSAIEGSRQLEHTDELICLDKAATITDVDVKTADFTNPWRICTVTQGMVLDPSLGSFKVPPASLSTFDTLSVILCVPIYDYILVPLARRFTGNERGFTELQRMGIGLVISVITMSVAAILEIKRLAIAREQHLVDQNVPVPLSIFWQIPQYFLVGLSEVFTFIGALEFFYDQSPDAMRSLCSALQLLTTAFGNYLSTFILTMVAYFTTRGGNPGWIPDNLNQGHLDYFFWLLAALSFLNLVIYVVCAGKYKSKKAA
ncbi:protein NRT1/ PTR FAMILY 8.3-like [Panicum miliaceum]|uniref:Protein NRT1/ PTR FAMILY 8.3-like n=1 Tax=Panicum miliaceum TaxID=4540 RepID=A0A3L6SAZ2_PANMI|nr:protein NRT1/ PTR FAMILY 8.3-like [Panicum miliaceum]